jgi:uncharacterized protein (DUF1684 family)
MANQVCIIVNVGAAAMTNVNGAGDDVPAEGYLIATLTDAEQATLAAAEKGELLLFVLEDTTPTEAQYEAIRRASKILRLGKNPSKVTTAGG